MHKLMIVDDEFFQICNQSLIQKNFPDIEIVAEPKMAGRQ